ncbi:hypothetical protein CVV38_01195 [Candidatus Peregrinibacteria bacterium HGW-Peregrinibacteria-1]|jgi:heterodisulfide reductase subunit C|nr:MAG: hypothetical protein CVV38_01195 [Candidatus Peregrinibacteria bacterium HGW-Peregrinibacteria-1]
MEKFVSTKEIYGNFKKVSDDVMKNGNTYVVLKYSKPAYKIVPFDDISSGDKKYGMKDLEEFVFSSKNTKENDLAISYKKYIYQV